MINLNKYDKTQLKVMACMAYYCLTLWQKSQDTQRAGSFELAAIKQSIEAISFTAANINVEDTDLWQIRAGNIKGLQNLNKFSYVAIFESNYLFDPYGEYGSVFNKMVSEKQPAIL